MPNTEIACIVADCLELEDCLTDKELAFMKDIKFQLEIERQLAGQEPTLTEAQEKWVRDIFNRVQEEYD